MGLEYVGEPMTAELASHLGGAFRALMVTSGLVDRATQLLESRGWQRVDDEDDESDVEYGDEPPSADLDDDERVVFDDLSPGVSLVLAEGEPWWGADDGCAWLHVRPFDETQRRRDELPVAEAGISFPAPKGPALNAKQRQLLADADFKVVVRESGVAAAVWATVALIELCADVEPEAQAERMASWAESKLSALLELVPSQARPA